MRSLLGSRGSGVKRNVYGVRFTVDGVPCTVQRVC